MFKLYNMNSRSIIDISPNEEDIIKTINDELSERIILNQNINLLVVYYQNQEPIQISIKSFEDFINYLENYKKRNNNLTRGKKR